MTDPEIETALKSYCIHRRNGVLMFFCRDGYGYASGAEKEAMIASLRVSTVIENFDNFFKANDAFLKLKAA